MVDYPDEVDESVDIGQFKKEVRQHKDVLDANNIHVSFNADFEKLKSVLLVFLVIIVAVLLVIVYLGYSGSFKSIVSVNNTCADIPACPGAPACPSCPECSPSLNCGNVRFYQENQTIENCTLAVYGMNFTEDVYLCSNSFTLLNSSSIIVNNCTNSSDV